MRPRLADCHLHFEGSLPEEAISHLARGTDHPFASPGAFARRRGEIRDAAGFLGLFADVCRLFRSPDEYADAARRLSASLSDDGVAYAEVYVSPEIWARFGLDGRACLDAVDAGFGAGGAAGGADCRILLDTVRQWGVEAAERVLDLHGRRPLARVVGFGMGGVEASIPAGEFAGEYARARALGLKTSVHAGEWSGPDSVREALDSLRPDRIDHGIAAAEDPDLLKRLAEEQIPLLVAPSGNVRTGVCRSLESHPLPKLLEAGVAVALSADDPLLFETSTAREYELAAGRFGLPPEAVRGLAQRAWRSAFGLSAAEREAGAQSLGGWAPSSGGDSSMS